MQQIADWLNRRGMSEHAERFAENDIDRAVLPDVTDQHLKDLGVSLRRWLKVLRDAQSRQPSGCRRSTLGTGGDRASPDARSAPGSALSKHPDNPVAIEGPPWSRNKARLATSQLGSTLGLEPRKPLRLSREPSLRRPVSPPNQLHQRMIGLDRNEG
jgi:SAM domain (Sterile alpha motif)